MALSFASSITYEDDEATAADGGRRPTPSPPPPTAAPRSGGVLAPPAGPRRVISELQVRCVGRSIDFGGSIVVDLDGPVPN